MKQIQRVLKLGRSVLATLRRHAAGEPLLQRHPPHARSRLDPTQLAGLRSLSRYNEDAYLVELQEKLHVVYGNKYSLSLICRALAKLGLRRKKVCTQLPGGQLPREPDLTLLHSATAKLWSATSGSGRSSPPTAGTTSSGSSTSSWTRPGLCVTAAT